jgi:hypothetical protein
MLRNYFGLPWLSFYIVWFDSKRKVDFTLEYRIHLFQQQLLEYDTCGTVTSAWRLSSHWNYTAKTVLNIILCKDILSLHNLPCGGEPWFDEGTTEEGLWRQVYVVTWITVSIQEKRRPTKTRTSQVHPDRDFAIMACRKRLWSHPLLFFRATILWVWGC